MRFLSTQFPNMSVVYGKKVIKFNNGVYETNDPNEQKTLKNLGFPYVNTIVKDKEEIKKSTPTHEIPKRWTKSKILKYAKEHNIKIPETLNTKNEIVEYIESL